MSADPFPDPPPGLDAVVRAALEADAARVDGRAAWGAVLARLDVSPAGPRRGRLRGAAVLATLAAALLVAVAFWPGGGQVAASPADVVRDARAAHAGGPDRCYAQVVELPPAVRDRFPLLADRGLAPRIWTRGDRFVVEPWLGDGAWGRAPDGRVWFAPSRAAAARFGLDELPPAVREAVAVRGMDLPTLLDDLLAGHDLTWTEPPTGAVYEITTAARGAGTPFRLAGAALTVDRETHAVRRLVLRRVLPGGDEATITFDLIETATRDTAAYTPAAHLDAGARVHDAAEPGPRRRVLLQGLGRFLAAGL
ncbi:hypothetical protein J0H58_06835 [bacterium]|nr:hypothetical protein [bacterium]